MSKTKMSKFDFDIFRGGFDTFAVSKERYKKEQAIELFMYENGLQNKTVTIAITGNAWVRHRAGRNEDNEKCVCWWLEYADYGRNCPVWAMHIARNNEFEKYPKHITNNYEYIEV
ncbi:MAG: hypothetical protein ACI4IS_00250 [Acutalibacteraceae bacterium]